MESGENERRGVAAAVEEELSNYSGSPGGGGGCPYPHPNSVFTRGVAGHGPIAILTPTELDRRGRAFLPNRRSWKMLLHLLQLSLCLGKERSQIGPYSRIVGAESSPDTN
jgi:hypothetical protein